jgi:hypothetical protein
LLKIAVRSSCSAEEATRARPSARKRREEEGKRGEGRGEAQRIRVFFVEIKRRRKDFTHAGEIRRDNASTEN